MSTEHALTAEAPILISATEGAHLHFLNHVATVKVPASGQRSMSVVEFLAPKGFGPPLHNHRSEDELFIIVEGALAFFTGDDRFESEAGGIAYLPQGQPHTFQVLTDTARLINVTSSNTVVPRFDEMVTALGTPTSVPELPQPGPIDPGLVAEICAAHGIDIVGPPPAPLT
jgi:quercetin dioxygenase-like cupin family protein